MVPKGDAREAVAAAVEHLSLTEVRTAQAALHASTAPGSRADVIQHQRTAGAEQKANAQRHELTQEQQHRLRDIAQRIACDESKLLTALREVGPLTAADMSHGLQISDPHARMSGMREGGVPIISKCWVRQPWGAGRPRTLRLYRLAEGK